MSMLSWAHRGDDVWAWEPERSGMYTVKSGYRKLYDEHCGQADEHTASTSGDITWSRIWKLNIPPKVRVFWWRVVNGFLPTRGELHRRHIEPLPNCEVCGLADESIKHDLLECTVARAFWEQVKVFTGVKIPMLHPVSWARDIVDPEVIKSIDAGVILCSMWSIWMSRNERKHGKQGVPVKVAVQWAIDTAFDLWLLAHPIKSTVPQVSSPRSWQPPERQWIKYNVDAAFYPGNGTASSGVVLRDHAGRTCGGKAAWYEYCLNALTAEAVACRDGMVYALERGVRRLKLESDCHVLVRLWNDRAIQRSEVDALLKQMEDTSQSFEAFDLSFVSRDCNRLLAHECARLVSQNKPVDEWLITPLGLKEIVDTDCNPFHG